MSDYLVGVLVGIFIGVIGSSFIFIAFSMHITKKFINKNKKKSSDFTKEVNKIKDSIKKINSVQERIDKVKDITKQQLDMQMQNELPQKNALDGKYKNSNSKRIKDLEEDKKILLQSILDDGFDPEITALNSDSKLETMKLSQFMAKENQSSKEKPKPKLKLVRTEDPDAEVH